MVLDRRLQILLDEERYARLERAAQLRGVSVARVLRDAIDAALPEDHVDRAAAAAWFLGLPPVPMGEWDDLKREIESQHDKLVELG